MVRVLSLFSGSLASRVATRLAERHSSVETVYLLHFRSPFAKEVEDLRQLVKDEWPGISFRTQSLKRDYRRLVDLASGGSFSPAQSCRSCRTLLFARAIRYMERVGADFIVTGEIVGEHGVWGDDLLQMAEDTGLGSRILRPLCTALSPDDEAPLLEWAHPMENASAPGDFYGALQGIARKLGLDPHDPLTSHKRCKLTMPGFGERVANLFRESGFTLNALRLLDFSFYYKAFPNGTIVVAVDEQEKRELQNLFLPQDLRVYPSTPHGPMTLVRTEWQQKTTAEKRYIIELAARITATHTGNGRCTAVPIYYRFEREDETSLLNVIPFESLAELAARDCVEIVPLARCETPVA